MRSQLHIRRGWAALPVVAAIALLAGCGDDDDAGSETEAAPEPPSFSYTDNGGPAKWGSLDPSYAECSVGKSQSPINLTDGEPAAKPELEVAYQPDEVELENNGHSVEAVYPEGSSITVDGVEYDLAQVHFHSPSEHHLSGQSFPIEFHFVNEAEDGGLAVLGVVGTEGPENPALSNIVAALPAGEGETAEVEGEVNAADLLPADPAAAPRRSYEGSLTTPPCTEGVRWIVFDRPIELSAEQIAGFQVAYDGNNRPLQPLNGREIVATSSAP